MPETAATPDFWSLLKFALNLLSAGFGISGTWLMSRRYARKPLRALLRILVWPLLLVFGSGKWVRDFLVEEFNANKDLPEKPWDTMLGLMLLFWAFCFQLVALLVEGTCG